MAKHILLGHVSKDIFKKKARQNSPVAPGYVPGEKHFSLKVREIFDKFLPSQNETLQNVSKNV